MPSTMCLYSASSMLARSLSAVAQSVFLMSSNIIFLLGSLLQSLKDSTSLRHGNTILALKFIAILEVTYVQWLLN